MRWQLNISIDWYTFSHTKPGRILSVRFTFFHDAYHHHHRQNSQTEHDDEEQEKLATFYFCCVVVMLVVAAKSYIISYHSYSLRQQK